MGKKKNALVPAVLLSAISSFVSAGEITPEEQGKQSAAAVASEYPDRTPYQTVEPVYSGCQRHTVVWSGGVARRGPDRIRPRPVRSRWQGADQDRIFCRGGNPFRQKRVADQPWIR